MAKKKADNAVNATETSKGKEKAAVLNDDKPAKKTQKTNSQKKQTAEKPNIFKRMAKGIKGVISELKKVTWPKGKDVVKNTAVVLVFPSQKAWICHRREMNLARCVMISSCESPL